MADKKVKIVHYLNRFFAGEGGEEQASLGLDTRDGAVGPARGLQQHLGDRGQVIATIFCGDNRIAEATEEVTQQIIALLESWKPDVLVAGPAFNAGRYGYACAEVCHAVTSHLGIPCVMALTSDNPGTVIYRQYKDEKTYALPTSETAAGMGKALESMARFALRLGTGDNIGHAEVEGYLDRGLRREIEADSPGAKRVVDMLLAKMRGTEFKTEVPIEIPDVVPPAAPLTDMANATIALLSTSGVVPKGNPDRFKHWSNTFWRKYPIGGMSRLEPSEWETVHGGYRTDFMFQNPHYGVPLDVLREFEDGGTIGKLHSEAYLFPGETMQYSVAKKLGKEIAQDLRQSHIDGVVLVST